jgi:periplasmic divalent cation tolerance protein
VLKSKEEEHGMLSMIVVYIVVKDEKEAEKIGKNLLRKRLAACINIIPSITSMSLWPPHKNTIEHGSESILICKTLADRFDDIERAVKRTHSYKNPALFSLPMHQVSDSYLNWLEGEIH